jgi:hypothetical protein
MEHNGQDIRSYTSLLIRHLQKFAAASCCSFPLRYHCEKQRCLGFDPPYLRVGGSKCSSPFLPNETSRYNLVLKLSKSCTEFLVLNSDIGKGVLANVDKQ